MNFIKSGIYKITSPTGRVYIGQSVNLLSRMRSYKYKNPKYQTRLFNSIKKYGWDSHAISIIEECSVNELNKRERYWQDFYNVLGDKGLNCMLTKTETKKHVDSIETRRLKSLTWYGKKHTEETKKLMSIRQKGIKKKTKGRQPHKIKNICGIKINLLTATNNYIYKGKNVYWEFLCDCGSVKFINKQSVISENIKSCGCLATKKEVPKIGDIFNRLTIIKFIGFRKFTYKKNKVHNIPYVDCSCLCGSIIVNKNFKSIKSGKIKSCGCLYKTHGDTKEYIYNRYKTLKYEDAKKYGSGFLFTYEMFKQECMRLGYKKGLHINKIDYTKPIKFDNIIISEKKNRLTNKVKIKIEYLCCTYSVKAFSKILGLKENSVRMWLFKGITPYEIINKSYIIKNRQLCQTKTTT